jgi:glutamate dehydrogenase (NAD(P)+)
MATPLLSLTWTDHLTGRQGFLVVDRLVRGVASGGLRMRAGCTLDEVTGLARGMTLKEALHYDPASRYVPLGGAKGGIDCDPRDPGAYPLLVRYLRAMRPYIESCWTTGEDLGLTQDLVDRAAAEAGLVSSIQAVYPLLDDEAAARRRLRDAFAVEVDGIGLDELVGGCGVAEAALAALDRAGVPSTGTRVALQGFGTMGGATARFLARAGLTVATHNLAIGVVVGTITAMVIFAKRVAHLAKVTAVVDPDGSTVVYRVTGELFFASSNDLVTQFDYADDPDKVVIDLSDTHVWDASSVGALDAIENKYAQRGKEVEIIGLNQPSAQIHQKLSGELTGSH